MIKLTIISVGNVKEGYLKDAIAEYEKRLTAYAAIENINLKEEKISDENNENEIKNALNSEGERIISSIPQGSFKIAMCVEGISPDSEGLAEIIKRAKDENGKIALIIGSSHGLCDKVKRMCDLRLSVSKLTFPHRLMRVILLEALYRSFAIIAGKKYHK